MLNITIDKHTRDLSAGKKGVIKALTGANGLPVSVVPGFPDVYSQFTTMGITDIRLHDGFGIGDMDNYFVADRAYNQNQLISNVPAAQQTQAKEFIANFCNIRTIFPYAAAGMRSNNYTLAFQNANYEMTNSYLRRIMNDNPRREILFRIGRTLDGGYEPPQNFDIYAALVKTLVERYGVNFAQSGLPHKITYWEIWNEPNLTFFWDRSDPNVYYDFFNKISRAIKSVDPLAKVGGAGVSEAFNPGGVYNDGLLNYCKNTNTPIDFYSFHYYANNTSDPQNIIDICNLNDSTLNSLGFNNLEVFCTEWNSTPTASPNIFTKLQSAPNASFIGSFLIYSQYVRLDKAYYYRGDASAFGLFNNNPDPANPNVPSICTYAGQTFYLFSKMLQETPFILSAEKTFNTGISFLAAENSAKNVINIFVANYKIDPDLADQNIPPKDTPLYTQYYVDSSRPVNQMTDDYSKNQWFGGIDPSTITTDNVVTQQNPVETPPPVNGQLVARARDYSQSDTGAIITIKNVNFYKLNANIKAYRIKQGGSLSTWTPTDVTQEVQLAISPGKIQVTDSGLIPYTVTLYRIQIPEHR